MRSKSLTPLGETEMEVLHHVWDLGRASVADVKACIMKERKIAYTTVMTVMKKLADKGYLQYEKDGTTYVYTPARKPEEVQSSLVDDLVSKVFRGSSLALVQTLVQSEELSDKDRKEIINLIDALTDDDRHDS